MLLNLIKRWRLLVSTDKLDLCHYSATSFFFLHPGFEFFWIHGCEGDAITSKAEPLNTASQMQSHIPLALLHCENFGHCAVKQEVFVIPDTSTNSIDFKTEHRLVARWHGAENDYCSFLSPRSLGTWDLERSNIHEAFFFVCLFWLYFVKWQ